MRSIKTSLGKDVEIKASGTTSSVIFREGRRDMVEIIATLNVI